MSVPLGSIYRTYLSRSRPHLPCGCSCDAPRTCADIAPGTAPSLSNEHHLARCGQLQGQSFSGLWQIERLTPHSPVACTPPVPPFLPSHHHRQSPIRPCAAPPVSQSSGCLLLPASSQRDLQGQGMERGMERRKNNIIYILIQIPSALLKLFTCVSVII